MFSTLKGKRVLVTGAGTGIGRQLCTELSRVGCFVYALSQKQSTSDSNDIQCQNIIPIKVDLFNLDVMKRELEKLEVMDGLVNYAGINGFAYSTLDCPHEYINGILNTSLLCAVNCAQVIAKKMISENVKGSIVNVTGVPSHSAFRFALPYNVSKAAMDTMSMQFALELQTHGIRVNTISPTLEITKDYHQTELIMESTFMNDKTTNVDDTLKKTVTSIMYLLSGHSSNVTGQSFVIDGTKTCDIFKPL